jgi:hypothetical protein
VRLDTERTVSKTAYTTFFLTLITVAAGLSATACASDFAFGNQNQGVYNASTFGGTFVSNFISPSDLGTITQIQVYLATGGANATAVVYSDSNGKPDALLATSGPVNLAGTAARWVSFEISYMGTPNTVYWLGIVFQNAGTYYYTDVGGKTIYTATKTEAPSQFPAGTPDQARSLSIYAVYTPAASSTPNQGGVSDWMRSTFFWVIIFGVAVAVAVLVAFMVLRRKQP